MVNLLVYEIREMKSVLHQAIDELSAVINILTELNPKNMIEIGVCEGGTLWCYGNTCQPGSKIIGIEPFIKHPDCLLSRLKNSYDARIINGFSYNVVEEVAAALNGESVGLLHIDGWHTYEDCSRDYEMYHNFVSPGGIILIHDIVRCPGVTQIWRHIRDKYSHMEIIKPSLCLDSNCVREVGYGVLFV